MVGNDTTPTGFWIDQDVLDDILVGPGSLRQLQIVQYDGIGKTSTDRVHCVCANGDGLMVGPEPVPAGQIQTAKKAGKAENLALRGQYDAAVREARLAVDLATKDAFSGPGRLEDLAAVYMLAGRHDEAIDLLDRLLKTVYERSITREFLRLDPNWDPLRENPRFKALLSAGNS